jgi:hypothetical protein
MSKLKSVIAGTLYGIGLSLFGFLLAGAGHGTFFLLGLAAAPFSVFGVLVAFFVPPIIWPAIVWAISAGLLYRTRFLGFILIHYLSAACLLTLSGYADGKYVERTWRAMPTVMLLGIAWYLVGQVVLWRSAWSGGPARQAKS